MAIISTEILSIKDFLSKSQLQIPHFQRPYKWTVKNVTQLIDDMQRFIGNNPYRIGTIVIYNDEEGNLKIVDGQQRTISFLLITKVIQKRKLQYIKSESLKKSITGLTNFKPIFKSDISIKNIQDNYKAIERKIEKVDEAFINYFYNKCEVTYFVINDVSEAFQFFDSQNARGRDLEPHDLLKAFHLRALNPNDNNISDKQVAKLVDAWEAMDSKELSALFADFMYRVRGWCKGNSSRYFTKKDTPLFKGINRDKIGFDPYTQIYKLVVEKINQDSLSGNEVPFPFQLDRDIINGSHFFEMVSHYKSLYNNLKANNYELSPAAQEIMQTLDSYEGRTRIGDKYVRMLFDCGLLYFVDKFGYSEISNAIEKIFVWAYTLRLTYQNLSLASVDNYVVQEINFFRIIRDATYKEDVLNHNIPLIREDYESSKTIELKRLFEKMHYYANAG